MKPAPPAASPADASAISFERILVAALLAASRRSEAAAMFETTLEAWEALPTSAALDRAVAAGGNNITTALIP